VVPDPTEDAPVVEAAAAVVDPAVELPLDPWPPEARADVPEPVEESPDELAEAPVPEPTPLLADEAAVHEADRGMNAIRIKTCRMLEPSFRGENTERQQRY
jgi:hypothetical protein